MPTQQEYDSGKVRRRTEKMYRPHEVTAEVVRREHLSGYMMPVQVEMLCPVSSEGSGTVCMPPRPLWAVGQLKIGWRGDRVTVTADGHEAGGETLQEAALSWLLHRAAEATR